MERISDFTKPIVDKRNYRYIELPNSLRCMLISDNETQHSAAALDVKSGSLNDPDEWPGLAHFCEHMLFLGTKKYPIENSYSTFIQNHGGDKNAYTSATDTNFFFSISNEAFPEALDRFSQFFKEPLFNEDATFREIDAVDSEHKKNLPSDYRKLHQLLESCANPASKISRFRTGNMETLKKPGIREALLDYHSKNYSANAMTIALLSNLSLDDLEKLAIEHFSGIVNKNVKILDTSKPEAYDKSRLGKLLKIIPTSPSHKIRVMWKFPDTKKMYKSKPTHYLSHILGHEGPNSLLSYLIDEKLAVSLMSYESRMEADTEFLTAEIELTEKGLKQYDRVIELAGAFAKLMQEKGPQEYIFEELKKVDSLKFKFQNAIEPLEAVLLLANNLHDYPREIVKDILEGPFVPTVYDPVYIKKLIDMMIPENMLIMISSETYKAETNLEEKWYKTKYSYEDFNEKIKTLLHNPKVGPSSNRQKTINLPPPNNLLPKNIDILPKSKDILTIPKLSKETPGSSIWYKQDHKFGVPKAYGFCRIWTNDNGFPTHDESTVFAQLYLNVFFEDIREFMYMAQMAGIECKLEMVMNKFTLTFYGFNESLPILVNSFLKKMREFDSEKCSEIFQVKHTDLLKQTINLLKETPYMLALDSWPMGITSIGEDAYRRLEILTNLTFDKFKFYARNWLKNTRLEWYISGNISEESVINTALDAEKILIPNIMPKELVQRNRTIQIPEKTEYLLCKPLVNDKEINSCIVAYFQGKPYLDTELKLWTINEVCFNFVKEPAFDYLRTKLQLGYVVDARSSNYNRILGGRFLVQSAKMCPEKIHQKINEFLEEEWNNKIKNMSDEDFKTHVEGVIIQLKQPHMSLMEEATDFWKEIVTNEYLFNRKEKLIAELEKLQKAEVISYFKSMFFDSPKRLNYELVAVLHLKENDELKKQNFEDAKKKGIMRIEAKQPQEMREMNFIYPDIFLLNIRNNQK